MMSYEVLKTTNDALSPGQHNLVHQEIGIVLLYMHDLHGLTAFYSNLLSNL